MIVMIVTILINFILGLNNVTFVLLLIGYLFSAFLIIGFGLAIISMALYMPIILFLFIFKTIGKIYKRIQTKVIILIIFLE